MLSLQQIIDLEPRISDIINDLHPIFDKYRTYAGAKRRLYPLVGIGCDKIELCSNDAYETVMQHVRNQLKL